MNYLTNLKLRGVLHKIFNKIILKALRGYYKYIDLPYQIESEKKREEWLVLNTIPRSVKRTHLTKEEKQSVITFWGITPASYEEFEIYKTFNGFDMRFMPMSIYLPLITRRLNDYKYTEILEHKSMFGYLTNGYVHYPKCFLRVINGEAYSQDMAQTDMDSALKSCLKEERVVIKDSVGGSGGKGISIIKFNGLSNAQRLELLYKDINNRRNDYVIQEYLEETAELKRFNPTSVNTIRVQSLYLNGRWSAVTIILRFGGENAEVDNSCSGGICVGVHPDGRLFEYGFNNQAQRFDKIKDIVFKDTCLSFIPKLLKYVEECHTKQYPIIKYIGWDFMIDTDGNPVCIEINSCQNGHIIFQLSAGPTFGDRTKEVIDYCNSKKFVYNKSVIQY